MEKIILSTPIVIPQITTVGFQIGEILLSRRRELISVSFDGDNGETREWRVEGDKAIAKLKALNTANLSVKSLENRCMLQAIADGVFAGAVTGAPDV